MKRMKKKTKTTALIVAGVLVFALLAGSVANLYGVFDPKEVNPLNVVSIEAVDETYAKVGTVNGGYGVTYTVEDDGTVKVKGTATANDTFVIATGITLEAGKTYTLSCGNDKVSYTGYGVRLVSAGGDEVFAELDGTFTAASGTYTLEVYVMDETTVNATFRPVLVLGNAEGDFYK